MSGSYQLVASKRVTQELGVVSYGLELLSDKFSLTAYDKGMTALTTIQCFGHDLEAVSRRGFAKDPSSDLTGHRSHTFASGRWGEIQLLHENAPSNLRAHHNLRRENGVSGLWDELRTLGVDISEAAAEYKASGKIQSHKPIDAICAVAYLGAGFWPIGTAIAGPTALGCVVMAWESP